MAETNKDKIQELLDQIETLTAENNKLNAQIDGLLDLITVEEKKTKPLKSYETGSFVQVLFKGEWVDGRVNEVTKQGIAVNTKKGPTFVAVAERIKPQNA